MCFNTSKQFCLHPFMRRNREEVLDCINMDWQPQDQESESSTSDVEEKRNISEDDSDNEAKSSKQTDQIRSELKSMSFAELLKLKQELGSKLYNEALFGVDAKSRKKKKEVKDFKRANKNRPREVSSKKQVPLLGTTKSKKEDDRPRDPRFDSKCGEFDRDKFKQDYSFVNEIREKEVTELKGQLRKLGADHGEEKKKIKTVLQRIQNQNLEEKRLKERKESKKVANREIKDAIKSERKPFYVSKREQKAKDLVKQFEELKKSGRLNKHLEKRRKKNVVRDRKKYKFD